MKKNKFIIILVFVALAAGAIAITVLGGGGRDDSSQDSSSQTDKQESVQVQDLVSADNPIGIDISTLKGPYILTGTAVESDSTTTLVIEVDAEGNSRSVVTADGEENTIIVLEGITYIKDPSSPDWIKYPASNDLYGEAVLGFTEQDIAELNQETNIIARGKEACSSGICRVYDGQDIDGGSAGSIWIDDTTNRLVRVTTLETDGSTSDIGYEYVDVSIVAPEGAIELDI